MLRDGATHTVKELTVAIMLRGDFDSAHTSDDNSKIVLTDTMKNTVYVLAQDHLQAETERFTAALARHFIAKYPQVSHAAVETREQSWHRLTVHGAEHPHAFGGTHGGHPVTRATATADTLEIESGIADMLILKSAGSSFKGYPRCDLTTLPETDDRILATSLDARWTWSREPADYLAANRAVMAGLTVPFALHHSPSVQRTLFEMAQGALDRCPEVAGIHLAMPNKHYLPANLTPFGRANRNEIFIPTDEPHGQIEATVSRA